LFIKDESIKDIYDLFRFNNLRVVYCPNDALGLDGPFKEVDEKEIVEILNGDFITDDLQENDFILEGVDIMVSGE
jgi:hypothetical protein